MEQGRDIQGVQGWCRMGSKGQDKLCVLCRKDEDSRMRHGALHRV